MRILAFTPCYYPHMGGAERTLHELYTRFANRECFVDLITIRHNDERATAYGALRVFPVGRQVKGKIQKFFYAQYWHWAKARLLMKTNRYDVIILTYGLRDVLVQMWIKLFYKIPVVILEFHLGSGSEISSAKENPIFSQQLLNYAYNSADCVIAISKDNAKFVYEMSGRSDTFVIPQGADPEYWSPAWYNQKIRDIYCPDGIPLLLTVSRLSPRKNLKDMIYSAARLREMGFDFRLIIVGAEDETGHAIGLQSLLDQLSLNEHVRLTGFLSEAIVQALYASSDLYLSTSLYEGFGLSIVQAMSSGLAVVCYSAKGTDDYFEDGLIGYLTEHDVIEFSDKCAHLLNNTELKNKMSECARDLVLEKYNWNRYATEHLNIISNIFKKY